MKELVFISSVQKELAEERRALKNYIQGDALLGRFFDVFLFEDMPAADRRADKVFLSEVDRCDVYLGLLGNDYGYEDDKGISPTEREFDRATAAGKQRLIFVKGENDTARHPKMQALVRKAGGQLIRRRFNNPSELTALAYSSLVEYLVSAGTVRTRPFDAAACPDATLNDLSRKKVQEFLARAQAERNYPLGPRTSTPKAMAHLNLLDGEKPTHSAVLLFGKQPQRFLMTSEIKCLQFDGTTVAKPIPDYRIFKGTVFELVDQAMGFVMSKIAASVGTRAESSQAPVTYEFPRAAVAEAIVNAVAHRDYASNASVQVMLFADRLEVWNPGELPPSLTPESLRHPHASIPRNPLLAEPLFLTRHIEKAGTGILDMIGLCKAAKLRPPEFRQEMGQFIQTLWRPRIDVDTRSTQSGGVHDGVHDVVHDGVHDLHLTEMMRKILAKLAIPASTPELLKALGYPRRTRNYSAAMKALLDAELIAMTRPDAPRSKNQEYRLTAKGRTRMAKGDDE
jgi:predicted HTH transcriptional regulator